MAAVLTSRLARSATHCPTSFLRACCMRPSRHHHTFVSSNTCRNVKFPSGAHLVRGRYLTSSSLCPSSDVGTRSSLFFPRRAVLYVPASDGRKVQKVVSVAVDSIVFDLEDGVAANKKELARESVGAAIATCRRGDSVSANSEHIVRVNGVESGLLNLDLRGVFKSCDSHGVSPDAIMLPKADSVEHIAELDLSLSYHLPPSLSPLPLYVMAESPQALLNLTDLSLFASHSLSHLRLVAMVFGSDDFLALMGGVRSKEGSELSQARQTVVTVARACGVDAIDMVDTDFRDLEGVRTLAGEAASLGFTGKQVIHPSQVGVVQNAFSPSQQRVEWAKGLIAAFERHQQSGQGAFVYEGVMIDKPLLLQAQNIVNVHNQITRTH